MARAAQLNLEALTSAYLACVRSQLLGEEQAARLEAAARVEAARHGAGRARRAAREAAEAAAAGDVRRIRAGALRAARNRALAAQRSAYEELRQRALAEVTALRRDDGYDALLDRLAAGARERLGEDATLTRDPAPGGGVLATGGGRVLDMTLPALAERCLDTLGPDIEKLWQ